MKNRGIGIIINRRMECNHTMSTILQWISISRYQVIKLYRFLLLEPTLILFKLCNLSLNNILYKGYARFEKMRPIPWKQIYGSHGQHTMQVLLKPLATSQTMLYMLPLFNESPTSPAVFRQFMKFFCQSINYINLGQTLVMEAKQPLSTLAKKLQTEHSKGYY